LAGAREQVSRLAVDEEGVGDVGRRAGDHGLAEHGDGVPPPPLGCTNICIQALAELLGARTILIMQKYLARKLQSFTLI